MSLPSNPRIHHSIHQLKCLQSILHDDDDDSRPRPPPTQQCQKLISGMKHVARLLPAAGVVASSFSAYADETRELALALGCRAAERREGKTFISIPFEML